MHILTKHNQPHKHQITHTLMLHSEFSRHIISPRKQLQICHCDLIETAEQKSAADTMDYSNG